MFLQTLIHTIKYLNTTLTSKEFTTFLHKINPEIHLSLHLILNCSPPPIFCSLQFSPSDQSYYLLQYKVRPLARPARRTSNGDWSLTRATSSANLNKWAGWFTLLKISYVPDLIWLRWYVSQVDIVAENTNIAIGERYSKFFIELFILELFRRPFSV